jgi:hypothetical protein
MAKIIDEIQSLKDLAQRQSKQGQHRIAAKTLRDAIAVLESALTRQKEDGKTAHGASVPVDTEENRIAAELADLYGMLGGASRKNGDLMPAIGAYDQGFRYESNPRYGIFNTYNALNRLVTRILMYPSSLLDPDALRGVNELEFVDVPRTLAELRLELKRQVENGVRSNDVWAAGDLAFACALNGDDEGALDAVQRFDSCSPPPSANAYAAYIYWIASIVQLDSPRTESLKAVKALFENSLSKKNRETAGK